MFKRCAMQYYRTYGFNVWFSNDDVPLCFIGVKLLHTDGPIESLRKSNLFRNRSE